MPSFAYHNVSLWFTELIAHLMSLAWGGSCVWQPSPTFVVTALVVVCIDLPNQDLVKNTPMLCQMFWCCDPAWDHIYNTRICIKCTIYGARCDCAECMSKHPGHKNVYSETICSQIPLNAISFHTCYRRHYRHALPCSCLHWLLAAQTVSAASLICSSQHKVFWCWRDCGTLV